jgi:hypothetical protein
MSQSQGNPAEFLTAIGRPAGVSDELEIKLLPEALPSLGGEMRTLVREKDWSQTRLGPREQWSSTLKTTIDLLLANGFPLLLWWGPQYISIYNDAYRPILGAKHPGALGKPFREVWPEIEQILSPLIDAPFQGGPSTWMEDILLEVNRHGFFEETHFTIAYSPVPDDTAPRGIGGFLRRFTRLPRRSSASAGSAPCATSGRGPAKPKPRGKPVHWQRGR